jgi:hypothetical protein
MSRIENMITKEEKTRMFFYFFKGVLEGRNNAIEHGLKRRCADKVFWAVVYE